MSSRIAPPSCYNLVMTEKDKKDPSFGYKDFLKLFFGMVAPAVCFICLFYFAYTPVPSLSDDNGRDILISISIWDILLFFYSLLLLFLIPALAYHDYLRKKLTALIKEDKESIINFLSRRLFTRIIWGIGVIVFWGGVYGIRTSFYNDEDLSWVSILTRMSSPNEPMNIRNVLLGLAGIGGLILAGWRSHTSHKQAQTAHRQVKVMEKRHELEKERRA